MRRLRRSLALLSALAVVAGSSRAGAQDERPPVQVRLLQPHVRGVGIGDPLFVDVEVDKLEAPPQDGRFWNPLWARNDQQIQYLLLKFRPLLKAELRLLEGVCKLNADQRARVMQEAEWPLQQAAENVSAVVAASTRGGRGKSAVAYRDPSRLIEEGLVRLARTHLSPRQFECYRNEVELRDADQKRFAARSLVMLLDDALYLSPAQREQLIGSLVAHWDDSWFLAVDSFTRVEQYVPNIPDECVEPFLTATQKTAWRALSKTASLHLGNFGFVADLMLGD